MFFAILLRLFQDGPLAQSPRRVLGLLYYRNNFENFEGEADGAFDGEARW